MRIRAHGGARGCVPLIVGAGEAGRAIGRDLQRRARASGSTPIGFLDDDETVSGVVRACRCSARSTTSATSLRDHQPDVVVIAIPALPRARVRQLAAIGARRGAPASATCPRSSPRWSGTRGTSDLRSLSMSHLIGRDEVHVVSAAARRGGRRQAGAGHRRRRLHRQRAVPAGRQLRARRSSYMLDHDESNLHGLQLRMSGRALLDDDDILIADVRDARRMEQVFAAVPPADRLPRRRPQAPAAARAAPLRGGEVQRARHPEPDRGGAAARHRALRHDLDGQGGRPDLGARRDQAAGRADRPGARQRPDAGRPRSASATCWAAGVPCSRVIEEQITRGEPVTVTHPDVTRFFMTVEEAVGLVLEAARMADCGEIFVLDMGEPVRVLDLVNSYAEQRHAAADVQIHFTGLRPGEKLNETLFGTAEEQAPTEHPRITVTRSRSAARPSCCRCCATCTRAPAPTSRRRSAGCSARCCPSTAPPRRRRRRRSTSSPRRTRTASDAAARHPMEIDEVAARILRRYWRVLLIAVLVPVALVAFYYVGRPPMYTADARLVATDTMPKSAAEADAVVSEARAFATSRNVVADAIGDAHVDRDAGAVLPRVSVSGLGSSPIVELSVSDADADAAQLLAQALATRVVEQLGTSRAGRRGHRAAQHRRPAHPAGLQAGAAGRGGRGRPAEPGRAEPAGRDRPVDLRPVRGPEQGLAGRGRDRSAAGRAAGGAADHGRLPRAGPPARPRRAARPPGRDRISAWAETIRPTVPGAARVARLLDAPLLGTAAGGTVAAADVGRRVRLAASRAGVRTVVLVGTGRRPLPPPVVAAIAAATLPDTYASGPETGPPDTGRPPTPSSSPTSSPAPAPSPHRAPARHRTPAQHRAHRPRGARRPDRRYERARGRQRDRWRLRGHAGSDTGPAGTARQSSRREWTAMSGQRGPGAGAGRPGRSTAVRRDRAPAGVLSASVGVERCSGRSPPAGAPPPPGPPRGSPSAGCARSRTSGPGAESSPETSPVGLVVVAAPVSRLSAVRAVRDLLTVSAWPLLGVVAERRSGGGATS